ncbi:mask-1, partial [Symbiodinium natans]
MGRAAFVSHQWLARNHPDPNFKQMRILQDALKRLMSSHGSVPLDMVTESAVPTAKPLPMRAFQEQALFVWYDFFSCPQQHRKSADQASLSQQADAISSIPAYVAKCYFFLALCPVLDCPEESKVLSATTWNHRGWCRVERTARELSSNSSWVLIQSDAAFEVVGTAVSFVTGAVGEGEFGIESDRQMLAPVMRSIILQKLKRCLRAGDLPGFRRNFSLQSVYLRGLDIEHVAGLLDSNDDSDDAASASGTSGASGASGASGRLDAVAEFLRQNGLRKACKADSAGWRPLHYAALAGDVEVLQGLLEGRADVNRRTSKDEPVLGFPPWMSALDLAVCYKHHDATRLLLSARANLEGGLAPALVFAAMTDNVEGIRLLCAAGGNPLGRNLFGFSPLMTGASYAATAAVEELIKQGRPDPLELSR